VRIKYILSLQLLLLPASTVVIPPTTTCSLSKFNMEDGLQQVFILLAAFLVFFFAYILQRREDGVIDSALSHVLARDPSTCLLSVYSCLVGYPKAPCSPVFTGSVLVFSSTAGPAVCQQAAPVSCSSSSFHSQKNGRPLHH
jgi:hypothetical protein